MKHSKIFGTLALVIILALLIVAIPAAPALAASITLSPTTGPAGTTVTVYGSGFTPGDTIQITFNWIHRAYIAVPAGTFTTSFTVPTTVAGGSYSVQAISLVIFPQSLLATAYFTVIAAEIEIDPDDGPVGTEVEISGEGFDGKEDIIVEYDGDEVDIEDGDEDTDSDGEFKDTIIIIPESTAGDHTITVIGDDSEAEAEADFTVESEITVDPSTGAAGDTVTVSGTGFGDEVDVTIEFDGDDVATDETDEYGSFEVNFTVPVKDADTYDVEANDDDKNKDTADFRVEAGVKLSQTTGNVGTELTVTGAGFLTNHQVTITYDDEEVSTTTTDSSGDFSASFNAPVSIHGAHNITASDDTNTMTLTFTVESTPPPTPAPLLPQMSVEAKTKAYFDWENVTDPSLPVTYTLQIASDADFTSIVLEKEGLTKSEYTITKDEKLESTKKEAPYYWRVRAIDGASNESEWSGVGEFYVGFAFAMPDWIIYVWFVIGALLVGFLGFRLGRRTSFYA